MSSDNTPSTDTTDESFAENPLQQYGYVRVYRAVSHQCGISAAYLYGLLEDYAQMGARTGKGCVPSHEHLAERLGCKESAVKRYLICLRDNGWITWDATGRSNRYKLKQPPVKNEQSDRSKRTIRQVKKNYKQEQENKTREQEPPVVPQTGDDPQFSTEVIQEPTDIQPWALWEAFCTAAGQDYTKATGRAKGAALRSAKVLVAEGITADHVRRCTAYLLSGWWKTGDIEFKDVVAGMGPWRMAGEKEVAVAPVKRGNGLSVDEWRNVGAKLDELEMEKWRAEHGGADRVWTGFGYAPADPGTLLEQTTGHQRTDEPCSHDDNVAQGVGRVVEAGYRVGPV